MGSMGVAVDALDWLLGQPQFAVAGVVCSTDPPSAWRVAANDRNMAQEVPARGLPLFTLDTMPPADLGLAVRFHQILRRRHLDRFGMGVVNLHGAPLPDLRGSMCEYVALHDGHAEYGASLHFMDEGADSGPLLCCDRFPMDHTDTPMSLLLRANATGLAMIKRDLAAIANGRIRGVPQGEGRTFTKRSATEYLEAKRVA